MAVAAFMRILDNLQGDLALVLALVDKVYASPLIFSAPTLSQDGQTVAQYYQNLANTLPHRLPIELSEARSHPYFSRLVRDLHQAIFAGGGDRGHVCHFNPVTGITLGK